MLEPNDYEFINKHGWIIDHDWELFSCLLGEPFLLNGLISYWDGKHFSICTWPVEKSAMHTNITDRLFDAVREGLKQFAPKLIEIWGPHNISLSHLLPINFRKYAIRMVDQYNVNLQIQLHDYQFPKNKNYRNAIRAEKLGLVFEVERTGFFSWQHYLVMEEFFNRKNIDMSAKTFAMTLPILARSNHSTIFNTYKNNELIGFSVYRELLQNVAIGAGLYRKRESRDVSDFLYKNIIEFYQKLGTPIFDLGYSVYKDLFAYKMRWGPNVNNGPYFDYAYAHVDYKLAENCWHWWARELVCPDLKN